MTADNVWAEEERLELENKNEKLTNSVAKMLMRIARLKAEKDRMQDILNAYRAFMKRPGSAGRPWSDEDVKTFEIENWYKS